MALTHFAAPKMTHRPKKSDFEIIHEKTCCRGVLGGLLLLNDTTPLTIWCILCRVLYYFKLFFSATAVADTAVFALVAVAGRCYRRRRHFHP